MTRRELITKTSMALGYTLSAPVLMGVLKGCAPEHTKNYKPVFFTDEEAIIVGDIAETMLPRTDTPGAKDVGVPAFIDRFINDIFSSEEKAMIKTEIAEFNQSPVGRHFKTFIECNFNTQSQWVKKIHNDIVKKIEASSEGWWADENPERPFLIKIKELTLLGFFTSKEGATQVLQYNQAPGPFQGCVPLDEVGKAWATS